MNSTIDLMLQVMLQLAITINDATTANEMQAIACAIKKRLDCEGLSRRRTGETDKKNELSLYRLETGQNVG